MSIYRWAKLDDQSGPDRSIELSGASFGTIRCEPQLFSDGDAGLQLELLADAVQPRRAGRGGHLAAHYAGHGAVKVSVRGGEDLESCRANRCELQRSLRRKRDVRKAHGSVARHHAAGRQLCAGAGRSADVNSTHDADEPDKPTCLLPSHNPAPPNLPRRSKSEVRLEPAPQVSACRAAVVQNSTLVGPPISARAVHRILCTSVESLQTGHFAKGFGKVR